MRAPGQSLVLVDGPGSARTRQGLCPLDPQQRAEPFAISQLGLFSGEGQPRPINVRVGPPLRTNPLTGSKGRCPWRGPGAAPLVGVRGEAPTARYATRTLPATARTLRGARRQIASAETTLTPAPNQNAAV